MRTKMPMPDPEREPRRACAWLRKELRGPNRKDAEVVINMLMESPALARLFFGVSEETKEEE